MAEKARMRTRTDKDKQKEIQTTEHPIAMRKAIAMLKPAGLKFAELAQETTIDDGQGMYLVQIRHFAND